MLPLAHKIPLPQKNAPKYWEIKTEGVIEYDPTIHREDEPYFQSNNGGVIRFREVGAARSSPEAAAAQQIEPGIQKRIQSNARLVRWSDGEWQLAVGSKLYNLQKTSSKDACLFQNVKAERGVSLASRGGPDIIETPYTAKNMMVYKAPISKRLIPSVANEEDALRFAKIVRKKSEKLKIKTEEIMHVQEKDGALKKYQFQSVPVVENELSNSNTLERIRELQRKAVHQSEMGRGAAGIRDGYDEENDFIFDGEVEEDEEDYSEGDQSSEEQIPYKKNVIDDEESDESEDQESQSEEQEKPMPVRRSTRLRGQIAQEDLQSLNSDLVRQINDEGDGQEDELVSRDEEEEQEDEEEEDHQAESQHKPTVKPRVDDDDDDDDDFNVDDVIAEVVQNAKQEN